MLSFSRNYRYRRLSASADDGLFWTLLLALAGGVLILCLFAWAVITTVLYATKSCDSTLSHECDCLLSQMSPKGINAQPLLEFGNWSDDSVFQSYSCNINVSKRVLCVDAQASTKGSGKCWKDPYLSLDDALEHARKHPGKFCAIFVADGEYRPSKTYSPSGVTGGAISLPENNPGIFVNESFANYSDNKALFDKRLKTFDLVDGVAIYGGFQGLSHPLGGERSSNERVRGAFPTILSGQDPDRVWHVISAGDDIAITGVRSRLDGLVIKGGSALDGPYFPYDFPLTYPAVPIYYHDDAGALYVFVRSEIVIHDCAFEDNAGVAGGAIYAHDGSTLLISASRFTGIDALEGGAIHIRSGGPSDSGGPTAASRTSSTLVGCEIAYPQIGDVGYCTGSGGSTMLLYWTIVESDLIADLDFQGCYIHDFEQQDCFSWGAINAWGGRVWLTDSRIERISFSSDSYASISNAWWAGETKVLRTYMSNCTADFGAFVIDGEALSAPGLGARMYAESSRFDKLQAYSVVGGVLAEDSSVTLLGNTFTHNAGVSAGAIRTTGPQVIDFNVFVKNEASAGPADIRDIGGSPGSSNVFCDNQTETVVTSGFQYSTIGSIPVRKLRP